ncbi:MAG TPA: N-acetyltransferase [Terriglobia bacterium]|nr:N-acetyltransferase [Terriglobia bacterium]
MQIIRKGELRDVPALQSMINKYADLRLLLPRTFADLCANIGDFMVAEENGNILACGALKPYDKDIAEIRSLCVEPGHKSSGLGRALTDRLLSQARRRKLKTVFALTVAPEFFQKCGFHEAPREKFPMKIWRDCLTCPKLFCCDEKTMAFELAPRTAHLQERQLESERVSV